MVTFTRIAPNAARLWVVLLLLAASPLEGATMIFNTSDSQFDPGVDNQGFWGSTFAGSDASSNYFVGESFQPTPAGAIRRNFFTFDLSSLSGTVVSATLEAARFNYAGFPGDPSETLGLFDVTTDAATLNNNTGLNATIFADLGSGTSYGTFVVSSYTFSTTETLTFALNANAIADINAAAGGFFSIGGALLSFTPGETSEGVFGQSQDSSGSASIQRLIVETTAVPEPGTLILLGVGLASLAGTILRK
jgi:hypothetical protein